MKRAALIVAVLAAVGAGAYFGKNALFAKQPVKAGTSMKLILMRQLEAGKEQEGAEVPFIVAEDVLAANGGVAIEKGAIVKAVVKQSRGENALSGVLNRPGRLAVSFVEVKTVDGQTLPVAADAGGKEELYSFTRANTGKQDVIEKLERLSSDADVKATLDKIQSAFSTGEAPTFDDPKSKEALSKISKELDLKALGKAIAEDRVGEISNALASTKNLGAAASALTSGNVTLAAVLELADVAGDVGSKLQRMLGGRTIRAYPGTEVTAYIAQGAEVRTK